MKYNLKMKTSQKQTNNILKQYNCIDGEFLPSNININNFTGILTCYFKGEIDSEFYNCKFNNIQFNNVTLNGFILGTINNSKCTFNKILQTNIIPDEYLNGDYDEFE
jgi:hypothetical protein